MLAPFVAVKLAKDDDVGDDVEGARGESWCVVNHETKEQTTTAKISIL